MNRFTASHDLSRERDQEYAHVYDQRYARLREYDPLCFAWRELREHEPQLSEPVGRIRKLLEHVGMPKALLTRMGRSL